MVEIIRHQILKTVYILTFCFTFFSPTPPVGVDVGVGSGGSGGGGGGCWGFFPFWIELYIIKTLYYKD